MVDLDQSAAHLGALSCSMQVTKVRVVRKLCRCFQFEQYKRADFGNFVAFIEG
jgi:hypothetical protein